MVAFNVLGLNVIKINVSPLAIAFFSSTSSVESIPISSIVNGSVIDFPAELTSCSDVSDFFIFLSLERIIFVSVPTSSYPETLANIST